MLYVIHRVEELQPAFEIKCELCLHIQRKQHKNWCLTDIWWSYDRTID